MISTIIFDFLIFVKYNLYHIISLSAKKLVVIFAPSTKCQRFGQ
ncbi:hypothetical protein HMPREF0908_0155 [Selenomonas flueggei ATCC 43531]|uniref:Uncharacterized protein n=1 Tax=Selenomonas flueggei ATCC 43531 TaxID=638302 RepID=C4V0P4_9FIRM|nr:hypothetical protein HMPREF0908_0155 [Selenomonas flueggei ATCC 43531]